MGVMTLGAASIEHLPLLTTLAGGFTAAWICGLLTQRIGLSPIVGYLFGGLLVGPHTPGFVADQAIASQLAEVGVILLMFGVGLHFNLRDLVAVRGIAVPGALVQSTAATLLGLAVAVWFGWEWKSGLVIGMAMAVASTVVLMRVLMDNGVLETPAGHAAVGWLIVEDIFTVVLLVLLPAMAGDADGESLVGVLALALLKLGLLALFLLTAGGRLIRWLLLKVALLRSRELFTLTVLVFAVAIAAGSAWLFGVSMALGAFLAGMAVGQSPVSQQVAADALPMRDAFAVIFFVSVGMMFDPVFLVEQPLLVLSALGIVMVGKPIAALVIVALLGYSFRTGLTVAVGLAQIGEFSFILAQLALQHQLIPEAGMSMLVAAAILSITVNPLLFQTIGPVERAVSRVPWLARILNRRHFETAGEVNAHVPAPEPAGAIIVGFGPAGRAADRLLRGAGLDTTIIDLNLDTVRGLHAAGRGAIFGDASNEEVLASAGIATAAYLVVTLPHSESRETLISTARHMNGRLIILARGRYLRERAGLLQAGASDACIEELEAAVALARLTLAHLGASQEDVDAEVAAVRAELEGTGVF